VLPGAGLGDQGAAVARRPPNKIAEIGTPSGFSHSGAAEGHRAIGTQNRALGWAAGSPDRGSQSRPCQSVRPAGGWPVSPSHHTSPSRVRATLVKMVSLRSIVIALGLVATLVPGAMPKNPASGLIARSRPSVPNRIQAMSSPIVSTRHPAIAGTIMARLVFPQPDGNAAAMYRGRVPPLRGGVIFRMSMCSASQPSSRAITEAIRSA
jgi:hypothetical protein